MKPIAIIQNESFDPPSYFATWLTQQQLPFEIFRMDQGAAPPADIHAHAGLCLLGGAMSVNDPIDYFPALFALTRQAVAQGVPVIGHCLGGQLLSKALGGTVQASEHVEIGWVDLQATSPQAQEWLGASAVRLFQWHNESFSIPAGATQLLRGSYCANQAYVVDDKHIGMQFHCEVDEPKVRAWFQVAGIQAENSTSPGVQTAAQVLPTLAHDLVPSQARAAHIYARWAQGLIRA